MSASSASELSAARVQRRNELYGPGRVLAREAAKQRQQKDHVGQNLMMGAGNLTTTHTDHFIVSRVVVNSLVTFVA